MMNWMNPLCLCLIGLASLVPCDAASAGLGEPNFFFEFKDTEERPLPYELDMFFFDTDIVVQIVNVRRNEVVCGPAILLRLDDQRSVFSCSRSGRTISMFIETTIDDRLVWTISLSGGNFFSGFLCPNFG